jgi:hypothetical protein
MTRSSITLALVLLLLAPACIIVDDDSSFTVRNRSDYVLVEVNLSPVDAYTWGPNLLRGDVLFPGESLTVDFIECDYYDARVIDETNVECILFGMDLCFDDALWVITNSQLDNCAFP